MRKLFTRIATVLALALCTIGLSACGDSVDLPGHKHKLVEHSAVDATCTTQGNEHYWACSGCGKNFADAEGKEEIEDYSIPATGHTYDRQVVDDKYLASDGSYYYSCTCGEFDGEGETFVEEHKLSKVNAVTPTCDRAGTIEYWHCSVCGKNFADENAAEKVSSIVDPATGHDYGEPVWNWATDNTSATATFTCTKGDDEQTVPATVTTKTTDATCEDDGETVYTAALTFDGHDYSDTDTVPLPATGHAYDKKVAEAEYLVEGEQHVYYYSCKCGEFDENGEIFEAHNLTKVDAVEPECEKDGNVEYWTCEWCDKYFADEDAEQVITDITVPQLGHNYTGKVVDEKYLASDGNYYYSCKNCGQSEENDEHVFEAHYLTKVDAVPPTCTVDGTVEYWHCSLCGKNFADEEADNVITDLADYATGHSYGTPVWNWAADNASATATFTCTEGDDEQTVTATVTTATTESTCIQKGNTTYTATVELQGETYTDEKVVEAENFGNHDWSENYSSDENNHWHVCELCDATDTPAKHTGGVATTEKRAECEVCGEEYGKLIPKYDGEALTVAAADAALTGNCNVQKKSDGTDFIGGLQAGDTITFTFYSQSENNVEFRLALANGGGTIAKSFYVTVTGEDSFYCEAETSGNGEWLTFIERHVAYLTLSADTTYTVTFEVFDAGGRVNLDYFKIIPWDGSEIDPPTPPEEDLPDYDGEELVLQAETDATLTGNCNAQGTFVGGLKTGDTITFKFNSTVAQDIEIILNHTNGKGPIEKSLRVIINEDDPFTFKAETIQLNGWTTFAEKTVAGYTLSANTKYTIQFVVIDAQDAVNIDYLKIIPWDESKGEIPTPSYEEPPAYVGTEALVLQAGVDASIKGDYILTNGTVGGLMNGSELTFKFKATVGGKVELVLAASTSAADITFNVMLNGTALSPLAISSLDNIVQVLDLVAGTNYTVVFTAGDSVRNNVNISSFKVVPYVAYTQDDLPLTYGAADVTPLNGCDFQNHGNGYQGHIIGNINAPGRGVMFSLNAAEEMTVHLSVYTDGNGGSEVTFEVIVNGTSAGTCTYTAEGWANFSTAKDAGNITLAEGKNTIEIKLVSGAMNFSHLTLSPVVEDGGDADGE